jgi:hypothetical protein
MEAHMAAVLAERQDIAELLKQALKLYLEGGK